MPVPFPSDRTFITPALLRLRAGGEVDPNILTRWQREGRVEKLRNGLYLNPNSDFVGGADLFVVANLLYPPSYVSLHSALDYWGLIPDVTFEVTSVSTRKTWLTTANRARYSYRQLPPKLFFGFDTTVWKGEAVYIAHPEKALIDYAYFHHEMDDPDYIYEMRFDEQIVHEELDWDRMNRYLTQAGSDSLTRRMRLLREVELL